MQIPDKNMTRESNISKINPDILTKTNKLANGLSRFKR